MLLKKGNIICLLTGLFLMVSAFGQPPKVEFSTNEIFIGEQVEISLKVGYPGAGNEIIFPNIGDTLLKNVEVVSKTAIDTINEKGAIKLAQTLYITSFDSGYYAIAPFQFIVNGETQETDAFLLTVKTVEVDTTAFIKDIKDIYSVPVSMMDYLKAYWPWIAASLALVAIIIALFLYFRKRKRKPVLNVPKEEVKKILPAHIIAFNALAAIKEEKIWSRHKVKEYHTAITDVLRTYIEDRFNVKAHEQTSGEILRNLRFEEMDDEARNKLRKTLLLADMVKFAKENPDARENEQSVDDAIRFVEQTKPQQENIAENKEGEATE